MSATGQARRDGAGLAGVGVAACAACCAGPIAGFLAAVGIGTALGVAVLGAVGLAVALLAIVPIRRRRRAAASCDTPVIEPVSIGRRSS